MQNKFEPLSTHNFTKLKSSNTKFSFIKVKRINSKEIKPIKSNNNLNAESLEKSIKKIKIFSDSKKINRTFSNILLRKNKQFSQKKTNIKIKLKNNPKKFHNNSAMIKKTNIKEIDNYFMPSFLSSQRSTKKIGPYSPICHLYYGYKKPSMSENSDDIYKKRSSDYFCFVSNNKSLKNKSKKNNNTKSTALSYSESCRSFPVSSIKNFPVENGIPNQFNLYCFDNLGTPVNKNVNIKNDNKNSMSYFKELDANNRKDISDNKIFLNKKEDTSLLTFGNTINESGNSSLRGYFTNNIYKENKQKNDTKKCISILQKENETLKFQLNLKNEKIYSLQQKLEQLLLNNNNINPSQNTHLKSIEQQCPLPTPYVHKYSQNEFHINKKKINCNKKIILSSSKNINNNNLKNKDKTKINNNFGKHIKNDKYSFFSPNSTRRFIKKFNNNTSKLIYKNQI